MIGELARQDSYEPDPVVAPPVNPARLPWLEQALFPHLSDPTTYAPLPAPSFTPNPQGKLPSVESDPRMQGAAADIASGLSAAIPFGGPVAGGAKVAVPLIAAARRLVPAAEETAAKGIRAYHGSPYDFERFDISKIGTGEGAQAYGHGLYFAENPAVAESYKGIAGSGPITNAQRMAINTLRHNGGDVGMAIETLRADARRADDGFGGGRSYLEAAQVLESGAYPKGRMYEVNIKARPEEFLNLDKPIGERTWERIDPNVRNAIDYALEEHGKNPMSEALGDYTGKELYKALKHWDVHESLPPVIGRSSWETGDTTRAAHTSAYLNALGFPGGRYLDARSREAIGLQNIIDRATSPDMAKLAKQRLDQLNPTSNYVVFDPTDLVDIMRKYGLIGGAVGGATAMGGLARQDTYQ